MFQFIYKEKVKKINCGFPLTMNFNQILPLFNQIYRKIISRKLGFKEVGYENCSNPIGRVFNLLYNISMILNKEPHDAHNTHNL